MAKFILFVLFAYFSIGQSLLANNDFPLGSWQIVSANNNNLCVEGIARSGAVGVLHLTECTGQKITVSKDTSGHYLIAEFKPCEDCEIVTGVVRGYPNVLEITSRSTPEHSQDNWQISETLYNGEYVIKNVYLGRCIYGHPNRLMLVACNSQNPELRFKLL